MSKDRHYVSNDSVLQQRTNWRTAYIQTKRQSMGYVDKESTSQVLCGTDTQNLLNLGQF